MKSRFRLILGMTLAMAACSEGVPGGLTGFPPPPGTGGETGNETTTGIPTIDPDTGADSGDPDTDGMGTTEGMDTTDGMGTTEGMDTGPGIECGNGVAERGEGCDGTDLAGKDCLSQGFDEGTLSCAPDCTVDTSACVMFTCGNDLIEGTEVCDGSSLSGESCLSQGFDAGTLGCEADCSDYDNSGCSIFSCGNGVIEGTELCDGADLGGQNCVMQGFDGGVLGCALNCAAYDTAGCSGFPCDDEDIGNAVGPSVTSGNTVGDDDDIDPSCGGGGGNDRVILFTAPVDGDFVFDTFGSAYDTKLALYSDCSTEISCNDDTGGLQSELTLAMTAGQSVLVVVDGFSGATGAWVLNISAPVLPCQDEDIGNATGASVTSGSTVADDDDIDPSCGGSGGNDRVIGFTAAANGNYVFDTFGSAYDTKLSLYSDCATEISCNDDAVGLQSELTLGMSAGEFVLVVVDGFGGATGDWILNITAP